MEVSRRSRDLAYDRSESKRIGGGAVLLNVARGRKRAILSRVLSSAISSRSFPSINVLETNTPNLRRVAETSPPFQERTGSRIPHRNRRCNYQTCIKTHCNMRVCARSRAISRRWFLARFLRLLNLGNIHENLNYRFFAHPDHIQLLLQKLSLLATSL